MREAIKIPAPIALPGKTALVRNYRCRPATWERGAVEQAIFRPEYQITRHDGQAFSVPCMWSYTVFIERPGTIDKFGRRRGGGYRIEVGDDDIRGIS